MLTGPDGRDRQTGKFVKGNPGGPGRTPNTPVLTPLIRTKIHEPHPQFPDKTWGQVMVERLMLSACDGDIAAFKEVIQRLDGKVIQPIDVHGSDDSPARIELPGRSQPGCPDAYAAGDGHRNGDAT
jgi:hypothetical protein